MHGRNHTKYCNKAQNRNIIWKKQQINKKNIRHSNMYQKLAHYVRLAVKLSPENYVLL
jgi:hypothetical protein